MRLIVKRIYGGVGIGSLIGYALDDAISHDIKKHFLLGIYRGLLRDTK